MKHKSKHIEVEKLKIAGSGSNQYDLNLYANRNQPADKQTLVSGTIPGLSHDTDTVEISGAARQLAASDIVNHAAKYFGTVQINESLTRLLEDQPSEVKEAVYGILQSNFITNVDGEQDRQALLELGLAQAQYIADNYMSGSDAAELMDTIRQIGAISKTRTIDPETNAVHYITPPQRPVGAPDDYIDLDDMMRRYEPETLDKLQDAIANGKDWASILLSFAKKVSARQDWTQDYRDGAAKQAEMMQQSASETRFGSASTASLEGFAQEIGDLISTSGFEHTGLLRDNMEAFIRTLENATARQTL